MKRLFFVLIAVFICSTSFGQRYYSKTESDAKYLQLSDTIPFSSVAYNKSEIDIIVDATTNIKAKAYQLMGGDVKAFPISMSSPGNAHVVMVDGRVCYIAFYIDRTTTVTGVHWLQYTAGNYVADNYNGFGLYSLTGTALAKIDSTANDGNIWKATANTRGTKAFTAPRVLTKGIYYIALVWNTSDAVPTTVPDIRTVTGDNKSDLVNANTNYVFGTITSQISVTQTPYSTSKLSVGAPSDHYFIWLY